MSNIAHDLMSPPAATSRKAGHSRAVAIWLVIVLIMVAGIVLVGGLTRLTDSGLSITEWKPVTGVVPPLSDEAWEAELEKYRSTTEYQLQNKGMSLDAFKTIYWWEWGHRLLARAIGLVVLFPLLVFWWRGALTGPDLRRGWVLFGLICAQGLMGWLMVISGLVGRLDVSQYRLVAHLGLAFIIFGWAMRMLLLHGQQHRQAWSSGRAWAIGLIAMIFLQILLGGLVAGLDAGLTYNTWPLMDGALIPAGLMMESPWWRNLGDNITMVQFQHRMVAYAVALIALVVFVQATRSRRAVFSAGVLITVTLGQVALGIVTLLAGADGTQPVLLGAAHQMGALALLGVAIVHAERLKISRFV